MILNVSKLVQINFHHLGIFQTVSKAQKWTGIKRREGPEMQRKAPYCLTARQGSDTDETPAGCLHTFARHGLYCSQMPPFSGTNSPASNAIEIAAETWLVF